MPYRHAHYYLLALFPLIAVAFWPNYLGQLRAVPFGLHAHGLSATAWLLLLTAQSWSIHARRPAVHRIVGRATFVLLPLFAAAGPLALLGMARLFADRADPFHAANGAGLVIADMIAGPAVVALVVYAFVQQRRMVAHAAAMLATAVLALPPIFGRLFPAIPGFPMDGALGMSGFQLSFQLSETVALAIALLLACGRAAARLPFGFAAAATVAQMVGFATLGQTRVWGEFVTWLAGLPAIPLAVVAGVVALALLLWAWGRAGPRAAAATDAMAPAAA